MKWLYSEGGRAEYVQAAQLEAVGETRWLLARCVGHDLVYPPHFVPRQRGHGLAEARVVPDRIADAAERAEGAESAASGVFSVSAVQVHRERATESRVGGADLVWGGLTDVKKVQVREKRL